MKGLGWIALASFVTGVAVLGYSVAAGESEVHLVLIFPVVTGGGALGLAGMGLIFLAMFLGFLSFVQLRAPMPKETAATEVSVDPRVPAPPAKFGGVVFLGPIPIVFGSSPRISKIMLAVGLVMTLLLLALFFLALR